MPTAQPLRAPPPRAKPAAAVPVKYPESDGRPMSETPLHRRVTIDATAPLEDRYRDRADVYVGSDMMMYYEREKPRVHVSPDVFAAFGVQREPERRVWKTWEEGKLADFVVEVTSESTRNRDEKDKRKLYQRLGVREYWQFDPTGDYLDPILKGQRLNKKGVYEPVRLKTAADGGVYGVSKVLGLHLCVDGDRLRYRDPVTGEYLRTGADKDRQLEHDGRQLEHKDRQIQQKDRQLAQKDRVNAEQARALEAARTEAEAARAEAEELRRQLAAR